MLHTVNDHRRRTIRLRGYDYGEAGAYCVTIVAQDRACLFGDVIEGEMRLSAAGLVVASWWGYLPAKFPSIMMDASVVMPNHLHGIVWLGTEPRNYVGMQDEAVRDAGGHTGRTEPPLPDGDPSSLAAPTLGTIMQWFKTMSTNDYIWGVKNDDFLPFRGRLWQRNYYEHIIRSDHALERIRRYIAENPSRWQDDEENLDHAGR